MENSTIRISRGNDFFGMMRSLTVYVDGEVSAYVDRNGTADLTVESGHHEVYVKMDWCSSQALQLNLAEGALVEYRAYPPGNDSFWAIFRPLFDMIFFFNDFFQLERRIPEKT